MADLTAFPEPEEFRELPWVKRVDLVTRAYMIKCTNHRVFIGNKMNNRYFGIRKFFMERVKPEELWAVYDYLFSLVTYRELSLTSVFRNSEEHRKKLISLDNKKKVAEMQVEQYKVYGIQDIMNW